MMQGSGLPVRGRLNSIYIFSFLTASLTAATSILSLIYRDIVYPTDEIIISTVPTDWANLIFALPLLLISMVLTSRNKLIGLLCWPAGLFYIAYVYTPYIISIPFNIFFLPYIFLVVLASYTLITLIAKIDGDYVRNRLSGSVPYRFSSAVLIALALFNLIRHMVIFIGSHISGNEMSVIEQGPVVSDLVLGIPVMLIGGILLWKKRPLGVLSAAALLLQYAILALGLIPYFFFQASYTDSSLDVVGLITILIMAAICFVPFAFFVKAARKTSRSAQSET